MPNQLLRYSVVRKADNLDDQKTPAAILTAETVSINQEELQEFVLSQIKRIIFDSGAGNWNDDFISSGIKSLQQLTNLIVSASQHSSLRQLIHFIPEGPAKGFPTGAYKTVTPSGNPFPTAVTWWASVAMTGKIVEKLITRNSLQLPTSITWNMYAIDGTTIIETVIDAITYVNNIFQDTITRTIV